MPLILAIEPDRRQASQLLAVVRGRLHAELVLADSAERALADLGSRIPDLILTSALLSPKDETALGERLRALDGAAAHVQTLTIPVLATGKSRLDRGGRGVLSALRRDRGHVSTSQGCDPAVFAEQCRGYLERAAAECERLAEDAALHMPVPVKSAERPQSGPVAAPAEIQPFTSEPLTSEQPSIAPALATIEAVPVESALADGAQVIEAAKPDADGARVVERVQPDGAQVVEGVQADLARVEAAQAEAAQVVAPQVAEAAKVVEAAPSEAARVVKAVPAEVGQTIEAGPVVDRPVVEPAPVDRDAGVELAQAQEQPTTVKKVEHEAIVPQAAPAAAGPVDIPLATAAFEAVLREAERSEPSSHQFSCAPASLVEAVVALEASESLARQRETRQELEYEIVDLDLSDLLDDPEQTPIRTQETRSIEPDDDIDAEPVDVYEIGDIIMDFATPMVAVERAQPKGPSRIEKAALPAEQELRTISETELYMALPRAVVGWPALEGFMDDVVALVAHETAQPIATSSNTNSEPEDVAEWLDIIEALRRDAEQVPFKRSPSKRQAAPEATQASEPAPAPISTSAPPPDPAQPEAPKKRRKRTEGGPVQDEWGFFDPEQCGFAALLAKLEEISDKEETPSPRRA